MNILQTPIEYLKGVGPQRGELLKKELGIFTYRDLLYHFPFRYVDKTTVTPIRNIRNSSQACQIAGKLISLETIGEGRKKRLTGIIKDSSGIAELVWFKGIRWIKNALTVGEEYFVYGKPVFFNGKISFTHPELEKISDSNIEEKLRFSPVYSTTEKLTAKGLSGKNIQKLTQNLLPVVLPHIREFLPEYITEKYRLISRKEALRQIHFPENENMLKKARYRLKFEELFLLQAELLAIKSIRKKQVKGHVFEKVGEYFNRFYMNHLPFELTNAQKRVIKEIRKDLGSGVQMNRLLQGDVGSGKTIVALLCMLLAIDNHFQAALMAPTEILASQHYQFFKKALQPLGIHVGLLTGSTKTRERKIIANGLESGTLKILIGTHALLEDKVRFQNLGLVIIDEQHRFGVAQRAKMWQKNTIPPHVLVMTATPIPRTLAMTVYGDLDVSVIDEMPAGRKPVKTYHATDAKREWVFGFMRREIEKGRQVYVVYPLIEESEKLDYKDLMDGY
ncbi:MAG: ATP-dependent DNA helicase RecG, partial [Bacteroidetes bacterium]